MKKLLFLLITTFLFTTACKKEASPKNTRLKTYSYMLYNRVPVVTRKINISYNNFNKISKVEEFLDDTLIETTYLIYDANHSLDSIKYRDNYPPYLSRNINIECDSFRIIQVGNETVEYNSNGLIDRFTNIDGSYERCEFKGDSVILFIKQRYMTKEALWRKYIMSSSIKNPFLISGFEREQYFTTSLFYFYGKFATQLPYIVVEEIGDLPIKYLFEGNFNGYPLKRKDITNPNINNRTIETFTYEEF